MVLGLERVADEAQQRMTLEQNHIAELGVELPSSKSSGGAEHRVHNISVPVEVALGSVIAQKFVIEGVVTAKDAREED